MDKRIEKYLLDVLSAIEAIESYFKDEPKEFSLYQKNQMRKKAIERNLEIIGEAVKRILNQDEALAEKITDARPIINLRNYIIHSYDSVSDENIWSILITHLPKLKTEVQALLNNKLRQ